MCILTTYVIWVKNDTLNKMLWQYVTPTGDFYFFKFIYIFDGFYSGIRLERGNASHFGHIDNSYKAQDIARVSHHMPIML